MKELKINTIFSWIGTAMILGYLGCMCWVMNQFTNGVYDHTLLIDGIVFALILVSIIVASFGYIGVLAVAIDNSVKLYNARKEDKQC